MELKAINTSEFKSVLMAKAKHTSKSQPPTRLKSGACNSPVD